MSQQVLFTQLQVRGLDGLPLAAAKVYFYRTGTTTLVTASDLVDAEGNPYTNPQIADSAGYIPQMFFNGTYEVKIVIRTAAGVTISTIDPAPLAPSVAANASGIVFTPVSGITSTNVQAALAEIAPLDEDDLVSNSATRPPTQQSIRAYVTGGFNIPLSSLTTGTGNLTPSVVSGEVGVAVKSSGLVSINAAGTQLDMSRATAGASVFFRTDTVVVGSISVDGSSTTYATSSDERMKENIASAGSASALIDAINVRSFDWKSGGSISHGFIAQELVNVVPGSVRVGDDDTPWGVDPSKLVALLVKEIQELRARVAALEP